jgi:AcrR family transcriptional regulator
MRALPDRTLRSTLDERAVVTRAGAAADQRRRILRATGELVAKRGYRAVTVELVCKRARVSYSTFYKHFDGKEQAFIALYDSFMSEGQRRIEAALATEPEAPWPQRVSLALRALFALIAERPLAARACLVESLTVSREIIGRHDAQVSSLAGLLRGGRACSPRAAELPATLEAALAGAVFWMPYQYLICGEVERIEALAPEALEFVLRPFLGDREAERWARWSQEAKSAPPSDSL